MLHCTADFETAGRIDLAKAGADRYAQDCTTEIINLGWSLRDARGAPRAKGVWHPGDDPREVISMAEDPDILWIAHNAWFEKRIWRRILVELMGWPDIPNGRWHCTQSVCGQLQIPQKLDRVLKLLNLPGKDSEGSKLAISMSKPRKDGTLDRSPATLARVDQYVQSDVFVEEALSDRIGFLQPGEREVYLLDQRINERGVRLDMNLVRAMQKIVRDASVPLAAEFTELTGHKITQRDKILTWCRAQGSMVPNLKKETVAELLGMDPDEVEDDDGGDECELDPDDLSAISLTPPVRRALEIRQLIGSASVKKLSRMEQCVSLDGRARGLLQYHAAGPGRWAGRLLQPHNFPMGTLKLEGEPIDPATVAAALATGDAVYVENVLGPAVEACVGGLRHTIVADKGKVLLSADYSGIECRVILALARQWDKVALLASGKDVYVDMAQDIYKRPIDKKRDPYERKIGKNAVLGLGFRMGWATFQKRYAKELDEAFLREVVRVYREEWAPEVPQVWWKLEDAALKTVQKGTPHSAYGCEYSREGQWLVCRLPSTRKIYYFNPRLEDKAMPWDPLDIRPSWTYQATKNGQLRTISVHGGLLAENVVQASARDIMKDAMLRLEAAGFPIVLTVHDEIVAEVPAAQADMKAFEAIMCDSKAWVRDMRVPIAVEGWIGERYRK